MTQPSKILWFAFSAAALLLLVGRASAQTYVTPNVVTTPPGQFIVVNNAPGHNHLDLHVDGDLVCYTDQPGVAGWTVRYFNLNGHTDNGVPSAPGSIDFLCDVRGTTIVFTRSSGEADVFTFDTASSTLTELDPTPGSARYAGQIGDQTIVWEDLSSFPNSASIVAYDQTSSATTVLSPSSTSAVNQNPGISPDGAVVVWAACSNVPVTSPCPVWKSVRSSAGMWASQQISQVGDGFLSDTDGTIIAYSSFPSPPSNAHVYWQPVAGGTEQVLNLAGSAIDPSVSAGLISFAYDATGAGVHQIAVYDTESNVLYNVTADAIPGDTSDKTLNDISVTPDGKVRVVWQQHENGQWNAYAYTFNRLVGDFNLGAISPLTIAAGGSGSTNVSVNPVNGFSSAVNLSVTGQPAAVSATLTPSQVTPSGGNPATSVLNVSLPDFITPMNFTLTVTGTSGSLTHSTAASVTVTATTTSVGNLIGDLLNAGCIDNAGIGNALTSKLSAAQSAGNAQTAINTLTALKNQINAQAGKHIATSCMLAGVTINPVTALLLDVQSLIDSLRVSMTPDPITGYVVDMNGVGVPGATVSILDANGKAVATATTDITGFYFFATTGGVLTPYASYTVAVTGLPAAFVNLPAASPAFQWTGSGMMVGTFVLN